MLTSGRDPADFMASEIFKRGLSGRGVLILIIILKRITYIFEENRTFMVALIQKGKDERHKAKRF